MPINDNGDIIRAVGFAAVYAAYLEDRIAELVVLTEKFVELRKNIHHLPSKDQAKHLLKSLQEQFKNAPSYHSKNADLEQIVSTLKYIEPFLEKRNHVIHSVLISNAAGIITQKNRRAKTVTQIKSKEVIDFANDIFELQSQVFGLTFPIKRLWEKILKPNST